MRCGLEYWLNTTSDELCFWNLDKKRQEKALWKKLMKENNRGQRAAKLGGRVIINMGKNYCHAYWLKWKTK